MRLKGFGFGLRCIAVTGLVLLINRGASAQLTPPNDAFGAATTLASAGGRTTGSTIRATRENGEPDHADAGGRASVWWSWTAQSDGGATFDTRGSNFDTVIAVYTGSSINRLTTIAANDDASDEILQSAVSISIKKDTRYFIAVDGYDGESGSVTLSWSSVEVDDCPSVAKNPLPIDGAEIEETSTTLAWNTDRNAVRRVIYGNDDRRDVYEVKDADLLAAWDSTVALVSLNQLRRIDDGFRIDRPPTFREEYELCPTEKFGDQPNPAWCSGFLVGADLVATAGHCITGDADCADVAFLFGFQMRSRTRAVLDFDADDVYTCREIVGRHLDDEGNDWSVIRLDRPVVGHEPLPIRREGKIGNSDPLVIIGHPAGLPAKIAGGARVRDNSPAEFFVANLDAYGGNSGSAVFNARTLVVEGILARGEPEEFTLNGNCWISRVCPDSGCEGEDVIRSTEFAGFIPPIQGETSYKIWFGACGALELLGETDNTSWRVDDLDAGEEYCWAIETVNDCGSARGPEWQLSTAASESELYQRGDIVPDGVVNLSDPITMLNWLFLGGAAPTCEKTVDADDSGDVNLTDSVFLLNHLFLGGEKPPEPFGECGEDPTEDELGCAIYAEC